MSDIKKDGGLAFPGFHIDNGVTTIYGGMSLRDYFAAAALNGLLASPAWEKACVGQPVSEVPSVAAEAAYELADAMLAEREKP